MEDFIIFFIVGMVAQLIDGALGMAYGLTTTTFLLNFGYPPVIASSVTHAAECITTGFSGLAHHRLGNVNRYIFLRLLIPGMIGAVIGVVFLTNVDGNAIKPYIATYLFILGCIILTKAFTVFPPQKTSQHLIPLGFFGALMDAIGGGGWGPIVTSTLLASGHDTRTTIGSVNATEFFIATTVSIAFFLSNVLIGWQTVVALALGGAIGAPFGALLCKYMPLKPLMIIVGLLIIVLSLRTLFINL